MNQGTDSSIDVATKRILIVDDEETVVRALALRCEQMGLVVDRAYNAMQAIEIMRRPRDKPDMVLMDLTMPGADGLALCDMIRLDTRLAPLPVIMLTGSDGDSVRRRCAEVGAHFVHKSVSAWQVLQPMIKQMLDLEETARADVVPAKRDGVCPDSAPSTPRPESRKKILVIDDDPAISKSLRVRFESVGYSVLAAYAGMQGYWMALKEQPDVIILDYKMPEGWGNIALGKLKATPMTQKIPVIIVSGMTDVGVQRDVMRLGAECWINKPFDAAALVKLVKRSVGDE